MPTNVLELVAGIAIGVLVAWLYGLVWKARYTATIREDAVLRSQAVTAGKVHEQLIPYLPAFPYNPKDVRFLGSPVDLVVFDGLAEGRVRRIVFVEVKTGGGRVDHPGALGQGCGPGSRSRMGRASGDPASGKRRGLTLCRAVPSTCRALH